jgi:hypothetical protein
MALPGGAECRTYKECATIQPLLLQNCPFKKIKQHLVELVLVSSSSTGNEILFILETQTFSDKKKLNFKFSFKKCCCNCGNTLFDI